MEVHQEIIPCGNADQVTPDFADLLPPGYRFHPTDSELIVDYLNAKIESKELPKCRLHEVNIYNHKPEELAEKYRSCENKWYFLTPRDRKYANGSRPNRVVRRFGYWKMTQKQKPVYDATRRIVGYKGNLVFYLNNKHKTTWLMNEYTANGPNLPFGSGDNFNKLNEWVLCKIYNKKKTTIPKKVSEEPNQTHDDVPSPKRRHKSENRETNFAKYSQSQFTWNASNVFQIFNGASSYVSIQFQPPTYTTPSVHSLNSIQPIREYSQNMFPATACNDFGFSNGALDSSSMEPLDDGGYTTILAKTPSNYNVLQEDEKNIYLDLSSVLDVQDEWTESMVVTQDDADRLPQPDSYDAAVSTPDEEEWSFELVDSLASTPDEVEGTFELGDHLATEN